MHQKAEEEGYLPNQLEPHYDELEGLMLVDFYKYVKTHDKHRWLHWNMRDSTFGFQAIAHRYRVLKNGLRVVKGADPVEIDEEKLINLPDILKDKYGPNYIVGDPKMAPLIDKNHMGHKDFLTGPQEADAFDNKEYVKLHRSTVRKVSMFARIVEKAYDGSLKTNAKIWEKHGGYPQAFADFLTENRWGIISGFLVGVSSLLVGVIFIPPVHDFLAHITHLLHLT